MQWYMTRARVQARRLGVWVALLVLLTSGCSRADLELADGSRASFADWQGRWIVINYWA